MDIQHAIGIGRFETWCDLRERARRLRRDDAQDPFSPNTSLRLRSSRVDMLLDMMFSVSDRRPRERRPWVIYDFCGRDIPSLTSPTVEAGFCRQRPKYDFFLAAVFLITEALIPG